MEMGQQLLAEPSEFAFSHLLSWVRVKEDGVAAGSRAEPRVKELS